MNITYGTGHKKTSKTYTICCFFGELLICYSSAQTLHCCQLRQNNGAVAENSMEKAYILRKILLILYRQCSPLRGKIAPKQEGCAERVVYPEEWHCLALSSVF